METPGLRSSAAMALGSLMRGLAMGERSALGVPYGLDRSFAGAPLPVSCCRTCRTTREEPRQVK